MRDINKYKSAAHPMNKVQDEDLHSWAIIEEGTVRKCKDCGRFQWWFGCLGEWRYDIPCGMHAQLRGFDRDYFNPVGKWLFVSAPICYSPIIYQRMEKQPEIKYERPQHVQAV